MNKWHFFERRTRVFRCVVLNGMAALGAAALAIGLVAGSASAGSLLDKIKKGEPIRIGYSNDAPWAYSGSNNEPLGISNTIMLAVLKKMGAGKVEPVSAEWGALIPGLQAGRFDIIADAMGVLPARCRNVLFTDLIATLRDALVVPKGNPKGLHSYADIRDKGATFVTGVGFVDLATAKKVGIPEDKILQVTDYTEIVQAVKVGRADAGGSEYLTLKKAIANDDRLELANPYTPAWHISPAFAFPLDEQAAVDAFNSAMKAYIGSDEMLASVSTYGYDKSILPGGEKTADLCKD
ncbi:ectoine/hydroxyectoine ABC transporter substrate-binding protein EhuB [Mesorhizobium humile]|uniref:Ectoine/hydroxyectoine ABC transporter substrate-binding protein EhuB n=1 Tax=Mesorhizobium humile TaxID=3072313 RepID=A0ABU4YNI9_9HYPH|nr:MULTISPECIES: ectoine/hydroxyectoine ABC transporter substrate-binding protein EhuB [unclassified Mesorhizobium]MDX8463268.1 ectoine/hydroxyectoine ABC transporter substrate-binding protein EhuB [Mesorhizobium sp. VK2D]MDX8488388.1 ectoine/hydroxyectoine ABC transporter substrate-binding protein EhuB [Mesorhizobium sp. VK2B]